MNSKSIPMVLGMLVLLAGGAWLIGRNLVSPPGGSGGTDTAGALEPDVPPKQAEARQLAQAGKLNEAQTMLAELLEFDPSNVSAAIDLGMILEQQGVPDAALDLAEKVLQIQPENSDGHLLRSRALVALDRFDEAELTCLRALEISPSNIAARYTIGLVRTAQGRPDRAIDAYLDRKLPGPRLIPSDARAAARLDQWTNVADAYFVPHVGPLIVETLFRKYLGGEQNTLAIENGRKAILPALDAADRWLASSPYFAGDTFSLADIHWMPYVEYLLQIGEGEPIKQRKNLSSWWERVGARETWRRVARSGPQPYDPGVTADVIEKAYRQ